MTTGPADAEPTFAAGTSADLAATTHGDGGGVAPAGDERALQKALEFACAHLNRRERTVAEVRAQLERRGVCTAHADAAVRTLLDQRLLDDARFAEMFVADKRELEGWGVERIRRGLCARGIDRELAERALAASAGAGGDGHEEELERALTLLRRRFPEPPRERRDRDRALGVLVRKGYQQELAIDALNVHTRGD